MEQYNSLGEKTRLIETSLKYTNGDMEKAKSMAAGKYKDVHSLKGKFSIESIGQSGFFYTFFNIAEEYIAFIDSVISLDPSVFTKIRIFDSWKSLKSDIELIKSSDDYIDSTGFTDYLLDSFIRYDLFPLVQASELDDLTQKVKEIISKSFNTQDLQCQIDIEQTSSLEIEMAGFHIDVPGMEQPGAPKEKKESELEDEEDERVSKVESEARFVVSAKVIVSPVKGKYINDITPGEKIRVLLSRDNPVSEKILTILKAIDKEGNVLPVKGRVREKIPLQKGGYIIYALVAKGVLAKIIEEENVKIKMDLAPQENLQAEEMGNSKLIIIMISLIALVFAAGILLIQFI